MFIRISIRSTAVVARMQLLVLVIMVRIMFSILNSNFESLEFRIFNPSGESFTAKRFAA